MIWLQARLGLRAPEVLAIQIDDIDWRKGEITIRGKGGLHDRLPLPPDVGEALVDYLRFERPAAPLRVLFITGKAPFRTDCGYSALPSYELDDDEVETLAEYDPFDGRPAH